MLVRAYLVFRPERAGISDETSSSMISEVRAGPRFGYTHTCSSLVEEVNSPLSFSMKVEAMTIDTISLGAPQKLSSSRWVALSRCSFLRMAFNLESKLVANYTTDDMYCTLPAGVIMCSCTGCRVAVR